MVRQLPTSHVHTSSRMNSGRSRRRQGMENFVDLTDSDNDFGTPPASRRRLNRGTSQSILEFPPLANRQGPPRCSNPPAMMATYSREAPVLAHSCPDHPLPQAPPSDVVMCPQYGYLFLTFIFPSASVCELHPL
ncbi:hypothetical protein ZOSMA_28G00420 [Zostera marina]|uniref:Uncharacterized protein n=1 Tax=Zostera marina TaxID=29655 RepID=A0A0K9PEQ1_ZOSMR|nr:hypothetical protein ZOSMA_28G00420 [Zostera marina]